MGDWADFVESYGYDCSDADAFDKISSKWENDERDSNIKAKYEAGLAKGKASPKKNYHNSKIKKFGFNNFKPYGDKVQSFSKKPITLIYGPNSIGKSSFIHLDAYINYINQAKNLDLISTDMFGDNINLGGYSKFIHKRNKDNIISIEYEFEDCSDAIIDYCNLQKTPKNILKALGSFSLNEIEYIIQNSEKYIHEVFNNNQTSFFGITNEQDEIEIEKFKLKRKQNNLCNLFYQSEFSFVSNSNNIIVSNFYKRVPYIFSKDYKEDIFEDDNIVNIDLTSKEDIKLEDNQTKNKFISDVLIPYYINSAKLEYLKNNITLQYQESNILDNNMINKIAELTISKISEQSNESRFLENLESSKIALKISAKIGFISKLNKVDILSVNYFLDNYLFDTLTYTDYFNGKGYSIYNERDLINTMEEDNTDCQVPNIFKNLPTTVKERIYKATSYNGVNKLHEKSTSILFLSYKDGYNDIVGAFNDMIGFKEMQYIGPLRFYPERDSSFKELDSNKSIIPDSQTSWSYLKKDEKLRENINKWLKDPNKLKTPYEIKYRNLYNFDSIINDTIDLDLNEIINKYLFIYNEHESFDSFNDFDEDTYTIDKEGFPLAKDKSFMFAALLKKLMKISDSKEELVFEDLRNGTQISNRDLGLGISQILPVLIATNHQKNTTIAIEQPELHLHPAVQCEIADEFIRSYKTNKNEFLIETHSEHLLLRIMKRMRWQSENKENRDKSLDISPDDVCLLYVDTNGETTYLNELELDEDGSLLDPWPNGFFEEGHKERFD